jgi:hypothetical protein
MPCRPTDFSYISMIAVLTEYKLKQKYPKSFFTEICWYEKVC